MLLISDSTILKPATSYVEHLLLRFLCCICIFSFVSAHRQPEESEEVGFKVQICRMQHYLIPCVLVIQTIIPICANARFGTTTIEVPLDGAVVPLSFPQGCDSCHDFCIFQLYQTTSKIAFPAWREGAATLLQYQISFDWHVRSHLIGRS